MKFSLTCSRYRSHPRTRNPPHLHPRSSRDINSTSTTGIALPYADAVPPPFPAPGTVPLHGSSNLWVPGSSGVVSNGSDKNNMKASQNENHQLGTMEKKTTTATERGEGSNSVSSSSSDMELWMKWRLFFERYAMFFSAHCLQDWMAASMTTMGVGMGMSINTTNKSMPECELAGSSSKVCKKKTSEFGRLEHGQGHGRYKGGFDSGGGMEEKEKGDVDRGRDLETGLEGNVYRNELDRILVQPYARHIDGRGREGGKGRGRGLNDGKLYQREGGGRRRWGGGLATTARAQGGWTNSHSHGLGLKGGGGRGWGWGCGGGRRGGDGLEAQSRIEKGGRMRSHQYGRRRRWSSGRHSECSLHGCGCGPGSGCGAGLTGKRRNSDGNMNDDGMKKGVEGCSRAVAAKEENNSVEEMDKSVRNVKRELMLTTASSQ